MKIISIKVPFESEVDERFLQGMVDRMMMSLHKYGPLTQAFPDKVDAISSIHQRLREYAKTGNTEFLMDAANFAMIEFMLPRREGAFFKPTDDGASPGRIRIGGGPDKRRNEDL